MNAYVLPPRRLSRVVPLKLTCMAMLVVLLATANAAAQIAKPDVNGGGGGGGSWVATVVGVSSSGSPSTYGSPVTLTVEIAPSTCGPNAYATVYDNGTSIGTVTFNSWGDGSLTTSSLDGGTNTITATFSGNIVGTTTCLAETSPPITQVVNPSTSVVYPLYKVVSIVYDAPGDKSQNGYTDSTTDGTRTSTGSNYTAGTPLTYSFGGSFLGFGGGTSVTFGVAATVGNSSEFTETFTNASTISNASTKNAIDHNQDLFVVWTNPAVSMTQTGSNSVTYSMGDQSLANGDVEPTELLEVYPEPMLGANGQTTLSLSALAPQWDELDNSFDLPGLAAICANNSLYQQQLAYDIANPGSQAGNYCTAANQCGCAPSDFNGPHGKLADGETAILAADPLLGAGPTVDPMSLNGSSNQSCGIDSNGYLVTPSSGADCHYLPVPTDKGSLYQRTAQLIGPTCQGCNNPPNQVLLDDSNMSTQTFTTSETTSVKYSWGVGVPIGSWSGNSFFSWTNSQSSGEINGYANSMQATFNSDEIDCYETIPIEYDTEYHTFVFWQPPGNSSCM